MPPKKQAMVRLKGCDPEAEHVRLAFRRMPSHDQIRALFGADERNFRTYDRVVKGVGSPKKNRCDIDEVSDSIVKRDFRAMGIPWRREWDEVKRTSREGSDGVEMWEDGMPWAGLGVRRRTRGAKRMMEGSLEYGEAEVEAAETVDAEVEDVDEDEILVGAEGEVMEGNGKNLVESIEGEHEDELEQERESKRRRFPGGLWRR